MKKKYIIYNANTTEHTIKNTNRILMYKICFFSLIFFTMLSFRKSSVSVVTRAAVWASFICGIGITVSNMFFSYIASPINAGAIAMIAGLVVRILCSDTDFH